MPYLLSTQQLSELLASISAPAANNVERASGALAGPAGQGWPIGGPTDVRGYALRTPWRRGPAIARTQPTDGACWMSCRAIRIVLLGFAGSATGNHRARAHLVPRFATG